MLHWKPTWGINASFPALSRDSQFKMYTDSQCEALMLDLFHVKRQSTWSIIPSQETVSFKCDIDSQREALMLDLLCFSWQALIFVVDSNDRERIGEATEELEKMVKV